MIVRKSYDTTRNIDNVLNQYATIYSIESLVDGKLRYGFKNGLFALMRLGDAIVCDVDDIPELASSLKPDIKREVLDIYDDIRDLGLERVWRQ